VIRAVRPLHGTLQQETEPRRMCCSGSVLPSLRACVPGHPAGSRPALQGTRGGIIRPVVGREHLQGTLFWDRCSVKQDVITEQSAKPIRTPAVQSKDNWCDAVSLRRGELHRSAMRCVALRCDAMGRSSVRRVVTSTKSFHPKVSEVVGEFQPNPEPPCNEIVHHPERARYVAMLLLPTAGSWRHECIQS